MIGPLEIVILIFVILLVTGAYRKLPQLGRSAGKGARTLGETAMNKGEKAKELAATVNEKHGDKLDPSNLAKQAGKSAREAREFKESLTGTSKPAAETKPSERSSDGGPQV